MFTDFESRYDFLGFLGFLWIWSTEIMFWNFCQLPNKWISYSLKTQKVPGFFGLVKCVWSFYSSFAAACARGQVGPVRTEETCLWPQFQCKFQMDSFCATAIKLPRLVIDYWQFAVAEICLVQWSEALRPILGFFEKLCRRL